MSIEKSQGDITEKEAAFEQSYTVQVYPGGEKLWDRHGERTLQIYRDVFDPLYQDFDGWSADSISILGQLEVDLWMGKPDTTFVTLEEKATNMLVGFTYATPDDLNPAFNDQEPYRESELENFVTQQGLSLNEYLKRQERTALVGATAIETQHRSRGGWSHMMTALEKSLRSSGKYDEMTRVVVQKNNYAEKLRRRYQRNIVTAIPDIPSPLGPQTYFRIRL